MLEKVFVPVDLSGSLETKTDPKLVLPSKLTALENGVFTVGSTITKRQGYSKLSTAVAGSATNITSGDALATFQQELLLFSGSKLFSYANGISEWTDRGDTISVTIDSDSIVRNDYEQSNPDIAYGNGLIVIAYEDTQGGIRATVLDSVSGAVISSNSSISATGVLPRCLELDGQIAVVYQETSGTDSIAIRMIEPDDPTAWKTAVTLATDAHLTVPHLDVTKYNLAGICTYANSSDEIKVLYITSDGAAGGPANGYPSPLTISAQAEDALGILYDTTGGDIYIAYAKSTAGTGLKMVRYDTSFALQDTETIEATSTAVKHVTLALDSDSNVIILYELNATASYDHLIKSALYTVSTSAMASAAVLKRSVGLASKAWLYNSKVYFVSCFDSTLQSTYFLLDSTGLIVAKLQSGVAGGLQSRSSLSHQIAVDVGIFQVPVQVKTRLVSRDNDLYSLKGVSKSLVNFTTTANFDTEELGQSLLSGGGFVSNYDGYTVSEHGFHLYAENVSVALAAGGSLTSGGTFQYKVIYQHTDAQGQISRSAPSVAVTASPTGSNLTATLTIPTLRLTTHTNVLCEVYRTTNAGTLFFRVGNVANSTSADTVSFSDDGTINDTNLVAKESLYTNGDILEHVSPPATSVIGSFNNRMFCVSSENPKTIFYSQKRTAGNPIEFSDFLKITMNQAQEVTAVHALDEKLIIFEQDRIFYITGDGPNSAGEQNSFSEPQLVTSDVGCSNTRSIVLMPNGLMFMSNKGIYMLDRGLSTHYIGAPVEAYNALTVTSAVLLQDQNQVRFTANDGVALIYDYFSDKWSTFSNHSGNGAVTWLATGKYCYLRDSGGVVFQQSDGYTDNGAAIQMKLKTAWIKPESIQGYQRCRRALVLGDYKSNHTLEARVSYDFREYSNELHSFNFRTASGQTEFGDDALYGDTTYGGSSDGVYQFRMTLAHQKCDAVRFEFADTVSTDPGQAYSISNLMLEIGLKTTPMKLPAIKST